VDGPTAGSSLIMLDEYGESTDWATKTYTVPTSGKYQVVFIGYVIHKPASCNSQTSMDGFLCLNPSPPFIHPIPPPPQTNVCIVYAVEPSIELVAVS
jgi:hypothetical protein